MYESEPIPFGDGAFVKVVGDTTTGETRLIFTRGESIPLANRPMPWHVARRVSRALFEATEAIQKQGEAELDIDHVSARWLGEMGKEQRSN